MAQDKEFPRGIFIKNPKENAPEFVIAKISIKREEALQFLEDKQEEWINLDVKKSREGKLYMEVDNWKPTKQW